MKQITLTVLLILGLLCAGCDSTAEISKWTGHYQGFVYRGLNSGPSGEGHEISGDVNSANPKQITLTLTSAKSDNGLENNSPWTSTIQIKPLNQQSIQVASDTDDFKPTTLSLNKASKCFESKTTPQQGAMQVCPGSDQVTVLVSDFQNRQLFKLQLSRLNTADVPVFEKPAAYTIGDLITRAKGRNFKTVVEFQRVLTARDQSINARRSLLPHFNVNDILNVASLSPVTILKSIGDFAPFLLPTRWARSKEAADQSNAETDSWRTIDADGMNISEGLAISAVRDSLAIARLKTERDSVNAIKNLVLAEEHTGQLQVGSSDDIASVANSVESTIVMLQSLLTSELAELSQASGFSNPQAISSISFGTALTTFGYDLDHPPKEDLSDWTNLVIARSPEMAQIDALLKMAQTAKSVTYFNWMDPSGADGGAIGFGLPSYISVAKDNIAEMSAQKDQVRSILITKISDVSTALNQNLQSYALASDATDINDRRVARITDNFKLGIQFSMSDLVNALQAQELSDLTLIDSEFGFYNAVSRMNRLLYTGPYSDIPFEKN